MMTIISVVLTTSALLIGIPVCVLFVEIVASIVLPQPRRRSADAPRPRVAVLVPAHNESIHLVPTLEDIDVQLGPADRLLVVVDNCSDDTAIVAARSKAEVVIRLDPTKIGKGYALDFGLRHLAADPPDVVVMIDADCRISPTAIEQLSYAAAASYRPVQALNLMTTPCRASHSCNVAEFAWRIKNWVRPLGLGALHLPCHLTGTGMAFPWEVIRRADLASGSIVEDLKLGVDLAIAGYPPLFYPLVKVASAFPLSALARTRQRTRWEQGHFSMIRQAVPRLISSGILRGDVRLVCLAFDLAVPPLSLLGILTAATFVLSSFGAFIGICIAPFVVSLACLVGLVAATFICWITQGRDILPLRSLWALPAYAINKVPMYATLFANGKITQWTRTERNPDSSKA